MIQKVGKDTIVVPNKAKPRKMTYKDVHFDFDGWADSSRFLPGDFDLVYLKIEGKKTISGWSTGTAWDGLKLEKDSNILFWKRKLDECGVAA